MWRPTKWKLRSSRSRPVRSPRTEAASHSDLSIAAADLQPSAPLASWSIEQATDPRQTMVTLRTADGFSVCFSMPREQQSQLGEALVETPAPAQVRGN